VTVSTERPLVSVVIGSYNRRPFLARALESVRANGASAPYELIVVDGGSTDGSIAWLAAQKDVITILQHNRGEFRGQPVRRRSWGYFMNLAFKCAQGRYVLMISDDCLLVPGAIDAGVRRFSEGMATPRSDMGDDGTVIGDDAGREIGAVAFYFRNWPNEDEYYVQYTFGGRMMVNHGMYAREVLERVGWVDEDRYLFYKADGDLSLKIWEAGFAIVDCPTAIVEHYEGANRAVRKSNREVLVRDRAAYRQRWQGIYWDPEGPDLRTRTPLGFDDPTRTASRFPTESPSLRSRVIGRAVRVRDNLRVRMAGRAHA